MEHQHPSPELPNPPCKYLLEPGMHATRAQEGKAEDEPPVGICQHRIGGTVCNAQIYMKPSVILTGVKFPSIADGGRPCLVHLSRDVDF